MFGRPIGIGETTPLPWPTMTVESRSRLFKVPQRVGLRSGQPCRPGRKVSYKCGSILPCKASYSYESYPVGLTDRPSSLSSLPLNALTQNTKLRCILLHPPFLN